MVGEPNFLSSTTLRPLGPNVTLTVFARVSTPSSRRRRALSSNSRILGISRWFLPRCAAERSGMPTPRGPTGRSRPSPGRQKVRMALSASPLNDGEHVARREDEQVVAVVRHLGAAVLRVEHDVADRDVERNALLPVFVVPTRADGHDGALLGLLLRGVRNDEPRSEEHTSELQSRGHLVCRLLLEKKKTN